MQDNITASMDSAKAIALTLLDLLAAFDTIDHNVFDCLRNWFGVDGTVLRWINPYLTNHKRKVKLLIAFQIFSHSPMVYPRVLSCGNSFLPFTLPPFSNIIPSFNITNHLYADDTQIYLATIGSLIPVLLSLLSVLLMCKSGWMV